MRLGISWKSLNEFEQLVNSPKLVDQMAREEIQDLLSTISGQYYFHIDFSKIAGDTTALRNWIALAKPEWIYIDPLSVASSAAFVGTAVPLTPVTGQYYYDTTNQSMMIYDGSTWLRI